jgi:hypothetical protein
MQANFEGLVPGLREQRETERRNRALAFAGLTHRVCGVEINPFTPRHRLALGLVLNAFVCGDAPLAGDVFAFLWLCSPSFVPLSGWTRWLSELRQWRLRRHVRRLDLETAKREVRAYLAAQLADAPDSWGSDDAPDQSPWVSWFAKDASFWMEVHGGFTVESYLATPYLVLQQLYRAWRCHHPDVRAGADGSVVVEHPAFINASDIMIGQWHAQRRDEIGAIIRSRTTRLP